MDDFMNKWKKRVEGKLQESNKARDDLLANLSSVIDANATMIKGTNSADVPAFMKNHIQENSIKKITENNTGNTSNTGDNGGASIASILASAKEDDKDKTKVTSTETGSGEVKPEQPKVVEKLLNRKMIKELQPKLAARVFGQDPVLGEVIDVLKISALNIKANKKRPVGNYMFAGPSGVGKTELAVTLSEALEVPMLTINGGEHGLEQDITKLIGTSPGYVGYNEGGTLTNFVSANSRCVVLIDEIEKAHSSIDKILLSILDKGVCTDNKGVEVFFQQAIIICTSNLGAEVEYEEGFSKEEKNAYRMNAIKDGLRPEIINRFDSIFHFDSLSKDIYQKVATKFLSSIQKSIKEEHGFELKYSEKMMKFIVDKSFDPAMGGRPASRFIEKIVIKPLADFMLNDDFENAIKEHPEVTLDINKDEKIYFKGKNRKVLGVLDNTAELVARSEEGKFSNKKIKM